MGKTETSKKGDFLNCKNNNKKQLKTDKKIRKQQTVLWNLWPQTDRAHIVLAITNTEIVSVCVCVVCDTVCVCV